MNHIFKRITLVAFCLMSQAQAGFFGTKTDQAPKKSQLVSPQHIIGATALTAGALCLAALVSSRLHAMNGVSKRLEFLRRASDAFWFGSEQSVSTVLPVRLQESAKVAQNIAPLAKAATAPMTAVPSTNNVHELYDEFTVSRQQSDRGNTVIKNEHQEVSLKAQNAHKNQGLLAAINPVPGNIVNALPARVQEPTTKQQKIGCTASLCTALETARPQCVLGKEELCQRYHLMLNLHNQELAAQESDKKQFGKKMCAQLKALRKQERKSQGLPIVINPYDRRTKVGKLLHAAKIVAQ
jgi:hypothetical protein